MKYKVGDKVRVRNDLELYEKTYYMEDHVEHNSVTISMLEYCGQVVTIREIYDKQYKIDGSIFRWTDEMFEGLAEETPKKFHVYDTVKHEKFGLGTVIGFMRGSRSIRVDFDYWNEDFATSRTDVACYPNELTLVQAYTGGEAD